MNRHNDTYELTINDGDGTTAKWETASPEAEYDAIHAAAGALLAGAESVTVTRSPRPSTWRQHIAAAKERIRSMGEMGEAGDGLICGEILAELSNISGVQDARYLFDELRKRGEIYESEDNIWKLT